MRKTLLLSIIILASLSAAAPSAMAGGLKMRRVKSVVSEFKGREGFEIIKVGAVEMALTKGAIRIFGGAGYPSGMALLQGLKSIYMVGYSEASGADREKFDNKISKALKGGEMLFEVKDDGGNVRIYGSLLDDGCTVKDFLIYSVSDCALICLSGSFNINEVMNLVNCR